jgi:DNA replication protein DnaC
MNPAQVDVVERTAQLLTRFNLSTAATELAPRLDAAGQREALRLVLEGLELEAEARERRKIARLRRAAQLPTSKTFETIETNTLPAPLMRKLRELAPASSWSAPRMLSPSACRGSVRATLPAQSVTR